MENFTQSKNSTVFLDVLGELREVEAHEVRAFVEKMLSQKDRKLPERQRKDAVLQLLRPFLPSRQEELVSRKKRNRVPRHRRPKVVEREPTPDLSANLGGL